MLFFPRCEGSIATTLVLPFISEYRKYAQPLMPGVPGPNLAISFF
jgi:hypothetical protein